MEWKEEFMRKLNKIGLKEKEFEKLQIDKIKRIPKYLYKYRGVNDYSLENLKKGTVWLSKPKDYNDSFECASYLEIENCLSLKEHINLEEYINIIEAFRPISYELKERAKFEKDPIVFLLNNAFLDLEKSYRNEILEFYNKLIERIIGKEKKIMDENHVALKDFFQNELNISSFCESNKELLMWSRYADEDRGFCIEYDFSKLKLESPIKKMLYPVVYKKNVFDYSDHLAKSSANGDLFPFFPLVLFSTKFMKWEYEKEWRAIEINFGNFKSPEQRIRHYPIEILSGIYFGSKTSEKDKERIYDIMNEIDGSPAYYNSVLNGSNKIEFIPWETSKEE